MANHESQKTLAILFLCSFVLTGCGAAASVAMSAVSSQMNKVSTESNVVDEGDKSALETRSIQVKEVDGAYNLTFRSSMDVLQDMGFTIAQTDMKTGHLVGIKKIPIVTTTGTVWSKQQIKTYIPQESTVTMEKWGNGVTRVRVVTDLGKSEGFTPNLSEADKARYLQPDKFYEEFFANLSKAVFLRKEKI